MTDRELHEGICRGGPLDEKQGQSRYSAGFILVDKPQRRVWIYARQESGEFVVREPEGRPMDDGLRIAAAESQDWDVRSAD